MNNTAQIIVSAATAFTISAGGAIVAVVGSGNNLNATAWAIALTFGAMSAAKDVRSLLKLPPVNGNGSDTATIKKP